MKESPKGRAGTIDGAVVEVHLGDPSLSGNDVIQSIHKYLQVLQLRAQHFRRENGMGMIKDAAVKSLDKAGGNPIAQPAGQHALTGMVEVYAGLQILVGD